jgi:lipopolysaccharide biosynthesis regulator YciM
VPCRAPISSGLNFLLNEQPDKAIEAFIEAVRIDPETVELHFALGSLFRRRGETDRAIRMHQNMVDREDLAPEQRLHALSELGQDYLKAGLLDRAEALLAVRGTRANEQRAALPARDLPAGEGLGQGHRGLAEAMPNHSGDSGRRRSPTSVASWPPTAMLHDRHDEARRYIDEALAVNRKCVRATSCSAICMPRREWRDGDRPGSASNSRIPCISRWRPKS